MSTATLSSTFKELRALMLRNAKGMHILKEEPGYVQFMASWSHPSKPKVPMWFGGVREGKAYVAYHLMAVYTHPELAKSISPALRKRMQGKSCFNFTAPDPALWKELEKLTARAARLYAKPMAK